LREGFGAVQGRGRRRGVASPVAADRRGEWWRTIEDTCRR